MVILIRDLPVLKTLEELGFNKHCIVTSEPYLDVIWNGTHIGMIKTRITDHGLEAGMVLLASAVPVGWDTVSVYPAYNLVSYDLHNRALQVQVTAIWLDTVSSTNTVYLEAMGKLSDYPIEFIDETAYDVA